MTDWLIEYSPVVVMGLAVGAVVVLTAFYYVSRSRQRRKGWAAVKQVNDIFTGEEYYRRYFADGEVTQITTGRILKILCDETGQDFSKIHPDERFDGPLSTVVDGYDIHEAMLRMQEDFGIKFSDKELGSIRSVKMLAEAVTAKLAET